MELREQRYAEMVAEKSNLTAEEVIFLMQSEKTILPEEAIEYGLANEIIRP